MIKSPEKGPWKGIFLMKKYEVVYIIHPDLEGSTGKITEKVKTSIKSFKGEVLSEEVWGKKKLAYPIAKNLFGIYSFVRIELEPAKMKELERTLKLSEEIIRYLVVQVEESKKVEPVRKREAAKPKKETAKEAEAKEAEEPKKTKKETEKEEKERQKELDEKLQAIIGPDSEF